mgnify:FL=1|tara:strand:- start:2961 stop:3311 length:351 start_codon:yes stop_codon:yes gene_type:complete
MDIYHIWCDLKPGQSDLEFVTHLQSYFDYLKKQANLQSYRITRRKLGLGPADLLEFHIMLDFLNLSDLDAAFQHVATRTGAVETFHHAVNGKVSNVKFALYRDFPDDVRETGGEKF